MAAASEDQKKASDTLTVTELRDVTIYPVEWNGSLLLTKEQPVFLITGSSLHLPC